MRKRMKERQWEKDWKRDSEKTNEREKNNNEIKKRENERLKVWGCRGGRNRAIPLNQV